MSTRTEREGIMAAAALIRLWYPDRRDTPEHEQSRGIIARVIADRLEQWAEGETP